MRFSFLLLTASVAFLYIVSLFIAHLYIHLSLEGSEEGDSKPLTIGELPNEDPISPGVEEAAFGDVIVLPPESATNGSAILALEKCPESRQSFSSSAEVEKLRLWKWSQQKREKYRGNNLIDDHLHPIQAECVDLPKPWNDGSSAGKQSGVFHPIGEGDFLYSAYLDDRIEAEAAIRIIALLKKRAKKTDAGPQFFCHVPNRPNLSRFPGSSSSVFQFQNSSVFVTSVPANVYEMCENHGKENGGWILSCKLPSQLVSLPPCHVYVSTQETFTQPENSKVVRLPVFRTRHVTEQSSSSAETFGVCIPPLFGQITARTLTDFVELTQILGADHLFFYVPHPVPTEVSLVLKRYVRLGIVTAVPWVVPVPENSIWYNGQLLAINDCLYRSMHAFRLVAFNDLDEFIVPHRHSSWREMIDALRKSPPEVDGVASAHCGYSFKSAFFDPLTETISAPAHRVAYDLESNLRTKSFSRIRNKLIVRPALLFELGIHHISRPLEVGTCSVVKVTPEIALLHHYRECTTSFDGRMNCRALCQDDSMATFLGVLRKRKIPVSFTRRKLT